MFYDQRLTMDGIMNISGALFLLVANMTFQNAFAVVSVSSNFSSNATFSKILHLKTKR
jgi:hypothetical protein